MSNKVNSVWRTAFFALFGIYAIVGFNVCRLAIKSGEEKHDMIQLWHNQALKKDIQIAGLQQDSVRNLMWKDSAVKAQDARIDRSDKATIVYKTKLIPTPLVSLDSCRDQLAYRDTVILLQDTTISGLKEKANVLATYEAREDTLQNKVLMTERTYSSAVVSQRDSVAAEIPKLQKKIDNPWHFGLYAGYGVTISGGMAYAGPQAGGGVVYTIRIRRKK